MSITEWMSLNSKTHLYSLPPPKKWPGVAKNDDSEIIEISRVLLKNENKNKIKLNKNENKNKIKIKKG